MNTTTIRRYACARVPTTDGIFRLYLYIGVSDRKEHIALVHGAVSGKENVLVRLHSECFTGDVLGSLRCDCGEQLDRALQSIGGEKEGILIYLRQEGRGIGLGEKLRAYNLQDKGFDTVDANLLLGYRADERDYTVAARILKDLRVRSIRLLTNNPAKIATLERGGIRVTARMPLIPTINDHNRAYLLAKARRMQHLLEFDGSVPSKNRHSRAPQRGTACPIVTLSYAQSIDGSIAGPDGNRITISGRESLAFIHQLRASHQAILVGIRTVIADDPRLTVRYARGVHPQPIVIDTHLRFPKNGFLLKKHPLKPWIFAADSADAGRCRELEKAGARVFRLPLKRNGYLSLKAVLNELIRRGMHRVMVEGGARIITGFLAEQLVNRMVITIAPVFIRGLSVCSRAVPFPRLANIRYRRFGNDVVVQGEPRWERA